MVQFSLPYNKAGRIVHMTDSFITFFHVHLVPFCITIYLVVCFVCFCLILYIMYSYCYILIKIRKNPSNKTSFIVILIIKKPVVFDGNFLILLVDNLLSLNLVCLKWKASNSRLNLFAINSSTF
jgi:hypothetical protein